MASTGHVCLTLEELPQSAAVTYLESLSARRPDRAAVRSDLLDSIRVALRGSSTDRVTSVYDTKSIDSKTVLVQELSWNDHTAILSHGGVIKRQWNFEQEGQGIQSACFARLEQAEDAPLISGQIGGRLTSDDNTAQRSHHTKNHIFGPFAVADIKSGRGTVRSSVPAIFIFLRSIGKIFLDNGIEYTFSLPFIVHKAWALHPHGIIIQRLPDSAEIGDEAPLPTIFTLTSPFSEPAPIGLTTGIVTTGENGHFMLKDEQEHCSKPLKTIPAAETIIAVSQRHPGDGSDILVTVDVGKHRLSIWRYVYLKPKDAPAPLENAKHPTVTGRSSSISSRIPAKRHEKNALHDSDVLMTPDLTSPGRPIAHPSVSAIRGRFPSMPSKSSIVLDGVSSSAQLSLSNIRHHSSTRADLSATMDRMAFGGMTESENVVIPVEHGRMKAAFWAEHLHEHLISEKQVTQRSQISVAVFDQRYDGVSNRSLLAICLPDAETLILSLTVNEGNKSVEVKYLNRLAAISVGSVCSTRPAIHDLLVVKDDHTLSLFTHGLQELRIRLARKFSEAFVPDSAVAEDVVAIKDACFSSATLLSRNGMMSRVRLNMIPADCLVNHVLQVLALSLPAQPMASLHLNFLARWSACHFQALDNVEFDCFSKALYSQFGVTPPSSNVTKPASSFWHALSYSSCRHNFCDDPALKRLRLPPLPEPIQEPAPSQRPHTLLAPILYALHMLAEDLRFDVHRYNDLLKLVPVINCIAQIIRPEWADYWRRLCPVVMAPWPAPSVTKIENLDDRIPVWPPDMSAILYGRISNPEWVLPTYTMHRLALLFEIKPSFAYGRLDPLVSLLRLTLAYISLADNQATTTKKRAETAVDILIRMRSKSQSGTPFLGTLPLGIAAPLREAIRTCQLSPPAHWRSLHHELLGRRDLAFSVSYRQTDTSFNSSFPSPETYMKGHNRRTVHDLIMQAKNSSQNNLDTVTGTEFTRESLADIRFGQDRRLEEAARMLCSSIVPSVRILERSDLTEHDQAKEQQHQVGRIAERTLALPYGRAMFTFGSVLDVTREAYAIPRIEFQVRIQPQNIITAPEQGKIPLECIQWGEFHNGVAAGLRISPQSRDIESSWIAFNKPSELTPEHAGFLFGLGLTGHLKEMLTWHTFGYLTPKHDFTSIGVLLGLAAANVGTSDTHVTKLLAVHTPALLPSSAVDLNVSLMTQAAGLAGVGLLYLGTKNRRMAEVCLNQISRSDLVQPDLSNEHREAYTYAAALSFGMTMLGKGSSVPADLVFLKRLRVLVHGDASFSLQKTRPATFDVNITSPAASIALGLMYMKTGRRDVADILEIPSTILALNRVQPSFLLMRTVARSLVNWNRIASTHEWMSAQLPDTISKAMVAHFSGHPADDAFELAYYNIIAGCCFAIGLKYAGTARHEAYQIIVSYFDMFSRLVYASGPAFDHKVKRTAIREGLNLISLSLCMVMAGTGEITCFRRLRYAYGMYHQAFRYGVHVSTHMSIGLLFLGQGRYTLGTSDGAIACMIAAFFPRFHHVSSDNKSYLQALRHLWVLAVEPRCLIARDVNTWEAVYLPVKITTKEGAEVGTTQLISPTLIPEFDKVLSIKVDTPRYWPFYLDLERISWHKRSLLQHQTLFVKRRTAFLSYTEDPRGSRSLFVRSGSSAGDAATLDFPQLTDIKAHPASDLTHFISSFSNDILFLAFADHLSRDDGETPEEMTFHTYCHAALLDSILQDKPETLQCHITLYQYRTMSPSSRFFHLRLQDLRFASDFYSKIYDRRFSGRSENNLRPPLIRENTVSAALHAQDIILDSIRTDSRFLVTLGQYARGEAITSQGDDYEVVSQHLSWYLLRNGVPAATLLLILKELAQDAYLHCSNSSSPDYTTNLIALNRGIKEVLHGTGTKMTTSLGSGWSIRSLEEIVEAWKAGPN